MKTRNIITLILMLCLANLALADEGSYTADTLSCPGKNDELLDLYEARILYNDSYNIGLPTESIEVHLDKILKRVGEKSPEQEILYRKWLETLSKDIQYIPNVDLASDTSQVSLPTPKGCRIKRVGLIQKPKFAEDKPIIIAKDSWDRMDTINRATLIFHMLLLKNAQKVSYYHAPSLRHLTALFTSSRFQVTTPLEWHRILGKNMFEYFYYSKAAKGANLVQRNIWSYDYWGDILLAGFASEFSLEIQGQNYHFSKVIAIFCENSRVCGVDSAQPLGNSISVRVEGRQYTGDDIDSISVDPDGKTTQIKFFLGFGGIRRVELNKGGVNFRYVLALTFNENEKIKVIWGDIKNESLMGLKIPSDATTGVLFDKDNKIKEIRLVTNHNEAFYKFDDNGRTQSIAQHNAQYRTRDNRQVLCHGLIYVNLDPDGYYVGTEKILPFPGSRLIRSHKKYSDSFWTDKYSPENQGYCTIL